MTDQMKISIVTAVFNREKTIVRALSSVRAQTYKNIELVIIDGMSTDNTVKLLHPFLVSSDVLCIEQDHGIYDALNKGINLSKGEVIAFLHSDDMYMDDNVISNVMKLFEDEEVDLVYGDVSFFNENNPEKVSRTYRSDGLSQENLAWGKMPAHPAIFVRRRVYSRFGNFKIDYQIAADYEFLCRLVKGADLKVKRIPRVLVKMQTGGASTRGLKSFYALNREVYRALQENEIYSNYFMILSKYIKKIGQLFIR